jgi:hypothetical protein
MKTLGAVDDPLERRPHLLAVLDDGNRNRHLLAVTIHINRILLARVPTPVKSVSPRDHPPESHPRKP